MNQILVTDKIYVTNKLKKKKKRYKAQFIASLILVVIFSGWYVYSEIQKNAAEAISQEILNDRDNTTADDTLVVAMDDTELVEPEQSASMVEGNYTDNKGIKYNYESILNIPSLGIKYPVLSETNDELLKISLNKFWGGSPNSVGNYVVVGHNYKSGRMFGKLYLIKNGDIVELSDLAGNTVKYKVYNRFVVYPEDVSCTSQITNGAREMTLITCTNGGKQRLVVKCRAI